MQRRIGIFGALLLAAAACGGSEKGAASVADSDSQGDKLIADDDEVPTRRRSRAPDIGEDDGEGEMQIEGLKGHIDPYDIQNGVSPHSTALATCFQKEARGKRFLGGQVELSFTVARDGTVKSVWPSKSTVGSWVVENCLLEESRRMKFVKPKGGEADFSLPLDFEAKRPAIWWTEEEAETEIGQRPGELKECAAETPDPRNVWVTLYLGNRGSIKSVGFATPNKAGIDATWATCAATKVATWTLKDPRGKIAKLGFRYNPE